MWNFLSRFNVKGDAARAEHDAGTHAKRRRPRPFAGAEPLEARALLSASGMDSPANVVAANALADGLPPVTAEVGSIESTHAKMSLGIVASESDASVHVVEPQFTLGLSDSMLAAIGSNGPAQRVSDINGNGAALGSFGDSLTGFANRSVELRFAETGQVVVVGSAASVQDSNGLTVTDDSAPTTYLRATDADGRAFSQLVFVTRAARSVPGPETTLPMDANEAVVAEAEILSDSNSEEVASRPELHEFATALDAASGTTSPASPLNETQPSLAAATRTRWMNSTRVSAERPANAAHAVAKSAQSASIERTDGQSDKDSAVLPALPVFDPTTRNVVLSVCLLGTLARATARHRRRQKAAALPQRFAAQ